MKRKRKAVRRRIGDVAQLGGVNVETIRFYERQGLIEQPGKPIRGWREYGERQIAQLSYVRLAQQFGLSLSDMRSLQASARESRTAFCGDVRRTLGKRLAKLEREIVALEEKRASLGAWLSQCEARGSTNECPLYVQLQPVIGKSGRNTS